MALTFLKRLLIQPHSPIPQKWLKAIYIGWLAIVGLILMWGLGQNGLFEGYSQAEGDVLATTSNLPNPLEDFLYYPYHLAVYLGRLVMSNGILVARIVSLMSALVACICFLYLLRRRLGIITSLIGATLFIFNSWIIHLAKVGTAEMSAIALGLALLSCLILIKRNPHDFKLKILIAILVALNWFTPLMPWVIMGLLAVMFYRSRMFNSYLKLSFKWSLAALCLMLVILMAISFTKDQESVFIAWGIPDNLQGLNSILGNFGQTLKAFVWQATYNPTYWLARLPFLDVFAAAMLPFGIYVIFQKKYALEAKFLLYAPVALIIIASLNQGILTPGLSLILPLLIMLAVAGVNEMMDYWRRLFPKNSLAKILGVVIILGLVNMSLFYQIRKYFVAFRLHPQTQQIYNLPKED